MSLLTLVSAAQHAGARSATSRGGAGRDPRRAGAVPGSHARIERAAGLDKTTIDDLENDGLAAH
jgi:hypothetical protein